MTQLPASSIISVYRLLIQATVANSPLSRSVHAQNGNCLAELHPLLFDYERPSWPSSYFVLAATSDGLKGDHSDSSSFHPLSFHPCHSSSNGGSTSSAAEDSTTS
ncbi:hypothetical protein M441DRAFT_274269 [Trichoderma asperellum CBS 433.97]|uniref:Uncharacterized protein n=1 Tax=Trichoderma asperellum (strain ATCC 204424 / CBS 433.97 / NBRC 101777) TaxID=1042311 RepID=A0A2T3YWX6_TRIA4|nr:hypothetical protein M441DRAFT_274269 [Trichoderma asperellum CBS 433.97]PTB37024.1 hypothetical protein M441DRAFT_274269 [Trichoderma asperellum CBS 433.97]